MVWNVEFQIAGLIIASIVAIMCFGQKRLNFKAEKAFIRLLSGIVVSIALDLLSVVAINYSNSVPYWLTQLVCKAYLFSILTVAFLSSWFAVAELSYNFRTIWRNISLVPMLVELVVQIIYPTQIYLNAEEEALYSYGITVTTVYVFGFVYLISILVMTVVLRDRISSKRRLSIYFWMATWMVVGIVQFINNKLLLASFAMSIASVYMYCKMENPENHLDFEVEAFNRKGFHILMDECIRFRRHRTMINISIDNLNNIRDIFGYKTVNDLMKEICSFFHSIPGITVFRLEKSLFALVFESEAQAAEGLNRVDRRLERPWQVNGVQINVNMGVSYLDDILRYKNADELEEVVRYFTTMAGDNGQGTLFIDDEELSERRRAFELQQTIEWALENDKIEIYYQPIYNIKAGRFSSMEALVRLRDENGNLMMPIDFIEFAEKNGMILKLGEAIFRKVCQFIRYNHIEDYGIDYIEVNLSVIQCMQNDLAREFKNIMGEYEIAPHKINIEVTETAAINTKKTLDNNMKELLEYGTSFSLDDFGSGYSNLTYVVDMPISIIKLDRSLTLAYDSSDKARVATEYSVEMIHKLGLEIVVEGVETEEQYLNFKRLGVEYIQGYYFSKPIPSENVLDYVREWM